MMPAIKPWALILLAGCLLGACASTNQNSYYSLSRGGAATVVADDPNKPAVLLEPIRLPVAVDRTQLVLRLSDQQLQVLETSRWAQPLKYELSSALVADLAQALPGYQVFESSKALQRKPQLSIGLEILQFESIRGAAATIEARWLIRDRSGKQATLAGHALVTEAVHGDSLQALASAHASALANISRQIAAGISRDKGGY